MKNHQRAAGNQRLLWITDPHLEKAPQASQDAIIRRLGAQDYDMVLMTGDVATAATLPTILPTLAEACGQRRLHFVLGNHEFAGADVRQVLNTVDGICRRHSNLTHLATSAPVRITEHTMLVGHHGLTGQPRRRSEDVAESSDKILHGIFSARRSKTRLLVATHYPPFHTSVLFNGQPCDERRQAFFCNRALGYMLIKMAFRTPPIRVLAGHTHHPADDAILHNLSCRVGGAGPGHTGIQGILMV